MGVRTLLYYRNITAFGIDPECWMRAAQDAPEWYRKVETGAGVFRSAWSTKRVNETNARHAKELFAALPFELPSMMSI